MCRWESRMTELGDGEEEGEVRQQKNERKRAHWSRRDWKENAQTRTEGGRKEGARGWWGGKVRTRGSYWLSPLHLPYWKKKAPDKIKCHHLGRDWRVPWLISARGPLRLSSAITSTIHQNSPLPRERFIWSKHMQKKWWWTGTCEHQSPAHRDEDKAVMPFQSFEW